MTDFSSSLVTHGVFIFYTDLPTNRQIHLKLEHDILTSLKRKKQKPNWKKRRKKLRAKLMFEGHKLDDDDSIPKPSICFLLL